MPARRRHPRPSQSRRARNLPARTAPAAATVLLLAPTAAGRTALAYTGAGLLLLLALTAAYASTPAHRTAARRTLHLLLRLAPWYPDRP
ncbi:hypothetical protein [Streptomyces soliscabiei]|uniref:hypothetical protein n=1 Tax=Streptomyces soliscabiei TaxID=588897 RepID=UPI0029A627CF|nr:hypothetical protein [Streptomyces sp. NY05-11A]MDX2680416.1 hypothetical protein [Streptomyces sp. NY05-11A]